MKYFEVKVEFDEDYKVESPMDSFYLFQLIGQSALCYIETFPDRVRDGIVVPVYKVEDDDWQNS
jgi:hypothetical protein